MQCSRAKPHSLLSLHLLLHVGTIRFPLLHCYPKLFLQSPDLSFSQLFFLLHREF